MIANDIKKILETGIALSIEKDRNKLLELIIHAAMDISRADGGTLYLYSRESNSLQFKIMHNHTMKVYQGGSGEEVNLPPVPMSSDNVCAYSALRRKPVNIPDVYHCNEFDFSGPKRYDSITGYMTHSMMVIPLANTQDETIGVLQLINATDSHGQVIPFSRELETIITSLASQAAIALTNSLYLKDIKNLFHSFLRVMITTIDQLSPYNVNHTRQVTEYTGRFADFLHKLWESGSYGESFSEQRREQLVMSAWMHDVGKAITPIEIMNKDTRLGTLEAEVLARFDMARATLRIAYLEGFMEESAYESQHTRLLNAKALIRQINGLGHLPDELLLQLNQIKTLTYQTIDDTEAPLLTADEYSKLSVRNGTLTSTERAIMQSHVIFTAKLLDNIHFSSELKDVPKFACMHHEYLDGSGYPKGLRGDEIPLEARILAIVDIYEALTSSDRPYKKSLDKENALHILEQMAEEGKLDAQLVQLFAQSLTNCIESH